MYWKGKKYIYMMLVRLEMPEGGIAMENPSEKGNFE